VLRRRFVLVFLVWTAAWAAAAAAHASGVETVAFEVTVEGSQRTVVTGVQRSVDDLGCSVRRNDVERQTFAFASREPGRIVAVRGRASSARLALRVEATGAQQRTRTVSGTAPECDVAPHTTESSCGPATFAAGATVALPSFGSVRLSGSAARRREAARRSSRPARSWSPPRGSFPQRCSPTEARRESSSAAMPASRTRSSRAPAA
jgi:hypothetical protein